MSHKIFGFETKKTRGSFARPDGAGPERVKHVTMPGERPQPTNLKFQPLIQSPGREAPARGQPPESSLEARVREEEVKLVQRLFFCPPRVRMVVFCGVEHGNGCSRVCTGAAETLASQQMGTVCVVDANLKTPSLHQYFGVPQQPGLTEALLQPEPIHTFAQPLASSNIWVLTSGSPSTDSHALSASNTYPNGLGARLSELRTLFDYVLIDGPPANLYADAAFLGQLADGVVLVVEAHSTRREVARRAKRNLETGNARVLAAVLNKRTFVIPESIYRKL